MKDGNCQNLPDKYSEDGVDRDDPDNEPQQDDSDDEDDDIGEEPPGFGNQSPACLPEFTPMNNDSYRWGDSVDGETFSRDLQQAYEEVVRWKQNLFLVPSGKVGEAFVAELSRLYRLYGESTSLEPVALTAAMTIPALLLQKPHGKSRVKEHIRALDRRLELWKNGHLNNLLAEGKCIQQRLKPTEQRKSVDNKQIKLFSKFMREGKVKSALRILSRMEGSVLDINSHLNSDSNNSQTVFDVLKAKHPPKAPVHPQSVVEDQGKVFHSVIFECIDGEKIQRAALSTTGAAGPSGIDANGWKRMCTAFKRQSSNLCNSLASVAKKLSTSYIDPKGLSTFTASRLIAIDKSPGVRPIAIGEVSRRIISKAILAVVHSDVLDAAGSSQLCAGLKSGCEAAVHAMKKIMDDDNTQAALLVDAQNAFNLLNRQLALINIHRICPSIAPILTNIYRGDSNLYVQGETVISREGVMQGDPLAMAMFAVGIVPLIREMEGTHQVWFADDAASVGSLNEVHQWWTKLEEIGPRYGYHPNPNKTWLIVKDEISENAQALFRSSGINITSDGRKHLGSAIGKSEFIKDLVRGKVAEWVSELEYLAQMARRDLMLPMQLLPMA